MKLIYRCLCAVLGAILGSGCSDPSEPVEYGPAPEYGVPTATVRLDGRVTDQAGEPIMGIVVTLQGAVADTTDAAGRWSIASEHVFLPCALNPGSPCTIAATDIDGPANGGPYPPTETQLDLVRTRPGSGTFDLGTWEQHGIGIVMTEGVDYGPPPAGGRR